MYKRQAFYGAEFKLKQMERLCLEARLPVTVLLPEARRANSLTITAALLYAIRTDDSICSKIKGDVYKRQVSSVDPGNASSVATGGEEQNSGSSSTPTQSQPDSTSNSTSVPAADGGGSDSTSAPPANSSSVPTDNGEETSSSSTSEIPEDSSAPENEDGTGEDESEEDKESEGDNSAEEFIPLAIIDPETGDVIEAEVGDEVTLSSLLNRDDILVSYQWQRMQQPTKRVAANIKPIYDYADGEATWYSFPLEEKTEAETLRDNPEAKWYGTCAVSYTHLLKKVIVSWE